MRLLIRKKELLFFCAFGAWLIYQLLEANIYFREVFLNTQIYRIVYIVAYLCLGITIMMNASTSISKRRAAITCFMIVALVLALYLTEDILFLLTLALFIISSRYINFEKILRFDLCFQILVMAFTVLGSMLGVFENGVRYRGNITRYFLGYKSTLAPMFLFFIVLIIIYLKKEKLTFRQIVLLLVVNQYFYMESNVRAPYYYTIISLAFAVLLKRINFKDNYIGKIFAAAFSPIVFVFTLAIHIFYEPSNAFMNAMNILFSSRLMLGKNAIDKYGFTLFGQNIDWTFVNVTGADYSYVDSAFLKYTLMYGIVIMIFVVLGLSLLMKRAWERNDKYLFLVLAVITINSIADPQLLYLQYNPFILLLGIFLTRRNKQQLLTHYNLKLK